MDATDLTNAIRRCQLFGDPVVIRGNNVLNDSIEIDLQRGQVVVDAMGAVVAGVSFVVSGINKPPSAWMNRLSIIGGTWFNTSLAESLPWLDSSNLCSSSICPQSVDGYPVGVRLAINGNGWCENNVIGGGPFVTHFGCDTAIQLVADPAGKWRSFAGTRVDNIHSGPCRRILTCSGRLYDSWVTRIRANSDATGPDPGLFEFDLPFANVEFSIGAEGDWDGVATPAVIIGENADFDPPNVRWGLRRNGRSFDADKYRRKSDEVPLP